MRTSNENTFTQESFEALLDWLDPDREQAALKYEIIRSRLTKIFLSRGCSEAEDLADQTISRVARKVPELSTFQGDPARYFYAVSNMVRKEYLRRSQYPKSYELETTESDVRDKANLEREYQCLEKCLMRLSPENRQLILTYYAEEKRSKMHARRILANQLGIATNALRIRAHRIRVALIECVDQCLQNGDS